MKTKLKEMVLGAWCLVPGAKMMLMAALCAVGFAAFAEPDAVQLWENGPYFATCNLGTGMELKDLRISWDAKADFGDDALHQKIKVKLTVSPK